MQSSRFFTYDGAADAREGRARHHVFGRKQPHQRQPGLHGMIMLFFSTRGPHLGKISNYKIYI